jgi:peptidoglycan lytic transglycosylase
LFFSACATVPRPLEPEIGAREVGVASWYGKEFDGRRTASGEVFDMNGMTAAHRTLPLGTILKVTHLENGRSLRVKVNDRGPFVSGRILDLSYGAASRLGIVGAGTARVRIEVVGLAGSTIPATYTIQVGAFAVEGNAVRLKERLAARYQPVRIQIFETNRQQFYRVRVGSYSTQASAEKAARELASDAGFEAFVTRQDPEIQSGEKR